MFSQVVDGIRKGRSGFNFAESVRSNIGGGTSKGEIEPIQAVSSGRIHSHSVESSKLTSPIATETSA